MKGSICNVTRGIQTLHNPPPAAATPLLITGLEHFLAHARASEIAPPDYHILQMLTENYKINCAPKVLFLFGNVKIKHLLLGLGS